MIKTSDVSLNRPMNVLTMPGMTSPVPGEG